MNPWHPNTCLCPICRRGRRILILLALLSILLCALLARITSSQLIGDYRNNPAATIEHLIKQGSRP